MQRDRESASEFSHLYFTPQTLVTEARHPELKLVSHMGDRGQPIGAIFTCCSPRWALAGSKNPKHSQNCNPDTAVWHTTHQAAS